MAEIKKNFGQGGSHITSERGDTSSLYRLLLAIEIDQKALLVAITDLDDAGSHGIVLPVLTLTKED